MLIQEALHEAKISSIAEEIRRRGNVKFVMIAGPSSSGKTSFSHRLSIQLSAHGLKPHPIAVDNYFVDREHTPLDEFGEKNYECLEAIDTQQFNEDMLNLLSGKTVDLPTFNFKTGCREYRGDQHQALHTFSCDPVIEISYSGNIQLIAPLFRFLLHMEDLILGFKRLQHIRVLLSRKNQHKAFIIKLLIKILHIAGIWCHKSVKIILEIFQAVNIHSGNPPITEQLFFIIHMMPVEHGNGIIRADTAFADRKLPVYQFPHPHFYPVKKLLIQGSTAFHSKIKSISNRIMDHNMIHILFSSYIKNCLQKNKDRKKCLYS